MENKNTFYKQLDLETVEKLAEIVNKNDLGEISITDGTYSLTVKGKKQIVSAGASYAPAPAMPAVSPAASMPVTEPLDTPVPETLNGTAVKAPIVGTYYSKPRPDASPFVTVGQKVKKGDVLYILETMKVMNEICAECDGIVAKILVNDGDALEYGQTVMVLS